ncbi:MAG: hypothetical protein WA840_17265 [Caulobacteraceae bacterium]
MQFEVRPRVWWSSYVRRGLAAVQSFGVLIAGIGLCLAALQFHDSRQVEAARFALQFDDRLTKPEIGAIIDAASDVPATKILTEHGGRSSDDSLDELLGDYDTLYYLYRDHLVNDQLMNDIFCADMMTVRDNAEVEAEIASERKGAGGDADVYNGFDKLAGRCKSWARSGWSHVLSR